MKSWINPFEKSSETRLVSLGIIFLLIGSLLNYFFNTRFDNFLHLSPIQNVKIYQPFLDNLVILLCLFIFLLIAGKIIYSRTRPIDILATALIGNAPFYLMSFSNIDNILYRSTKEVMSMATGAINDIPGGSLTFLAIIGIISILILFWVFCLFYNGFKTATNSKGTKSALLFITAILLTFITTVLIPLP